MSRGGPAPSPSRSHDTAAPAIAAPRRAALLLGLQTGLLVALVVVLLVGTALFVVLRGQHAASADLLAQAVSRADDVRDPPAGVWLAIEGPQGLATSAQLPAGFPDRAAMHEVATTGQTRTGQVEVGGVDYLVHTAKRGDRVVQGVLGLSADEAVRDRLVGALLLAAAVGLALAVAAGLYLASRAVRPLAATLALQRRFVADASHELRTPLTLLSTRAQLVRRDLRRGADPAAVSAEVDGLVADADNLALVLEDLLLAADPRGGAPVERVDLAAVAAAVVAAGTPAAAASGIALACELPEQPVPVAGSVTALRRAVTALLDNAVRHARERVTVAVTVTGTTATVAVVDDGPGIEPVVRPRLFERYESSAAAPHARRQYGLGLALVAEVAARHGGAVSARDDDGAGRPDGAPGTVMELVVPLAR